MGQGKGRGRFNLNVLDIFNCFLNLYFIQECGRVKEKDVDFYIMGGKKAFMDEFIFMVCF